MNIEALAIAFALGFTGSFHCVGMCGPIAMAVPYPGQTDAARWLSIIKYLVGKTITYTFLGMLMGLFGRQIILVGFQQALSIALGILLLCLVTLMLGRSKAYHQNKLQAVISNALIPVFGNLLKKPNSLTPFLLGMLNGLLPCGLVYLGLLGATAAGTAFSGGMFMLGFGLGTTPVMFSFLALANRFSFSFREKIKKATPYFIAIAGIMLILRGMNLGIPFISPEANNFGVSGAAISCHP